MRLKIVIIGLLALPCAALAQQTAASSGNAVVMVVGRPMSVYDSLEVKRLYLSALRERTVGNNDLAMDLYNQVLQTDPANDAAMYDMALLKKLKGNASEAQNLLEKAVTVKPENEWYWLALTDSYEKTNDLPKLAYAFNELVKINPAKPEYYLDEANALYLGKKYTDALAVYDKLQQQTGPTEEIIAGRQRVYLKQGDIDKATAQLEQLIAANPDKVRYYLMLAEIYNTNKLQDKGLKVLLKLEKEQSHSSLAHLALADIYRDKKDYQNSYDQLKLAFALPDMEIGQKIKIVMGYVPRFPDPNAQNSALELSRIITQTHPADASGWALYGDMLVQNHSYKEAYVAYQKSIELNNHVSLVYVQLVRMDFVMNNIDAGLRDGEQALLLFPNEVWLNYLVGMGWMQKKASDKAIPYLKKVTQLETSDSTILGPCYARLGDSYHDLKQDAASDEAYDKALIYTPDDAYTLNNYAYYLSLRNEQMEKAARMAKHANELLPNTASFEDTYAWILFKQKDYTGARTWIEKALQHGKTTGTLAEHYGDILFELGDTDNAIENWKKARQYGARSSVLERKINEKRYIE